MSYSINDAKAELTERMATCVETRDVEDAHKIADLLAEAGDDEGASTFKGYARRWEAEDNAHDEANGN